MVPILKLAKTDDNVVVKVHVRCRGCLNEAYPLATLDRPPPGVSPKPAFYRQKLWRRMPFRCDVCGHEAAILAGLDYATADDLIDRSDPYPFLPPSRLMRSAKASDPVETS